MDKYDEFFISKSSAYVRITKNRFVPKKSVLVQRSVSVIADYYSEKIGF